MKGFAAVLTVLVLVFCLVGCGGSKRYGYNPLYSEPRSPCAGECVKRTVPEMEQDLREFARHVDSVLKELSENRVVIEKKTPAPAKAKTPVVTGNRASGAEALFGKLYR